MKVEYLGDALSEEMLKVLKDLLWEAQEARRNRGVELELSRKLLWEAQAARKTDDAIRIALATPVLDRVSAFADGRQLGFLETVYRLRDSGESFARFGDGEIKTMLRSEYKLGFQQNSVALGVALRAALHPVDGLLTGFPHVYRDVHWSAVWADVWGQLEPMVSSFGVMGNSHVTRPIFFQSTGQDGVEAWRSVWEGKSVTVVTGEGSRFDLIPELFDNLAGSQFLYSRPTDAFGDLPRLLSTLAANDSDIVLIALGPAGTVLASQLAKAGRRAIDVGHISDSFENVFRNGAWPEAKALTTA